MNSDIEAKLHRLFDAWYAPQGTLEERARAAIHNAVEQETMFTRVENNNLRASLRTEAALRAFASLLANPNNDYVNVKRFAELAVGCADLFVEELAKTPAKKDG